MSSIENKKPKFSIGDFEKGLILLGLLTPKSSEEIQEKSDADELTASVQSSKSKTYFKRVVLAAEIVNHLRTERTFGRIKFQKLVYMCEHVAEMNLAARYAKFAAGPFDNKFMHSINKEFKKHNWFEAEQVKSGDYSTVKYHQLSDSLGYKKYYTNYFSSCDKNIQSTIELFRYKKTDETELAATTLACILELEAKTNHISWASLFEVFYNWHDKKKRFTQPQIISTVKMLKANLLVPADIDIS